MDLAAGENVAIDSSKMCGSLSESSRPFGGISNRKFRRSRILYCGGLSLPFGGIISSRKLRRNRMID